MKILQRVRRTSKWRLVLQVYDGRECPECAAVVIGPYAKQTHRNYHEAQRDWQDAVIAAMELGFGKLGLATVRQQLEEEGADLDYDERLTEKAKFVKVKNTREYDDDDDEDDE